RLLRVPDSRLLSRDDRQLRHGQLEHARFLGRLADAGVDHNLGKPRHLHDVAVLILLAQVRHNLFFVSLSQSGLHDLRSLSRSLRTWPLILYTRPREPSLSVLRTFGLALPADSHHGITLLTWIGASLSTIPPRWFCDCARMCFFTMRMPSTSTRPRA